jgi:hypothetical protein
MYRRLRKLRDFPHAHNNGTDAVYHPRSMLKILTAAHLLQNIEPLYEKHPSFVQYMMGATEGAGFLRC